MWPFRGQEGADTSKDRLALTFWISLAGIVAIVFALIIALAWLHSVTDAGTVIAAVLAPVATLIGTLAGYVAGESAGAQGKENAEQETRKARQDADVHRALAEQASIELAQARAVLRLLGTPDLDGNAVKRVLAQARQESPRLFTP